MSRHADYLPHGVIPAVLLPFADDLAIDEKSFRKHLREVAATPSLSAITVNAHSTEVASCSFEEQRRVLDVARDHAPRPLRKKLEQLERLPRQLTGPPTEGRLHRHGVDDPIADLDISEILLKKLSLSKNEKRFFICNCY